MRKLFLIGCSALAVMTFSQTAFAAGTGERGWVQERNTWKYYKTQTEASRGWLNKADNWYYLNEQTGAMETGWKHINGAWYFLDTRAGSGEGIALKGWQWIDGYCYYFVTDKNANEAKLLVNTKTPDGFTVDENGRWTENGKVQHRPGYGIITKKAAASGTKFRNGSGSSGGSSGGGSSRGGSSGNSGGSNAGSSQGGNSQGENQGNQGGNPQDGNQGNHGGNSQGGDQGNQGGNPQDGNQGNHGGNSQGGDQGNPGENSQGENQGNQGGNPQDGDQGNKGDNSQGENQGNQGGNPQDGNQGNSQGENQGNQGGNPQDGNQGNNQGGNSQGENQGNQGGNPQGENQGNQGGNSQGGDQGNQGGNSQGGNQGNNQGGNGQGDADTKPVPKKPVPITDILNIVSNTDIGNLSIIYDGDDTAIDEYFAEVTSLKINGRSLMKNDDSFPSPKAGDYAYNKSILILNFADLDVVNRLEIEAKGYENYSEEFQKKHIQGDTGKERNPIVSDVQYVGPGDRVSVLFTGDFEKIANFLNNLSVVSLKLENGQSNILNRIDISDRHAVPNRGEYAVYDEEEIIFNKTDVEESTGVISLESERYNKYEFKVKTRK